MRRFPSKLVPLLAATLALGACGPVNRGLESVNQPVISRTHYAIDLGTGGYEGLTAGEPARLGAWFDSLKLGYGDRVAIDDPAHGGGAAAREAIASVVARYGLLLTDTPPITEGAIGTGQLRVVVSRSVADVPACPNYRGASQPNFTGSSAPDYGCAINGNLAAMTANPEDLVRGVAETASRSNRATLRAGDAYQKLVPTGVSGELKAEKAKGGGN